MNKFRMLILASVLVSAGILSAKAPQAEQSRAYGPQTATGTSSLATAQYTKPITPAQVNNTGGYEVKMPGYYFLTEDLHFYPKNFIDNTVRLPRAAAIYIATDNVVLDLNNKTLTHLDGKTLAQNGTTGLYSGKALENPDGGGSENIAGIRLAPGVRNVTIKNGTLQYILGNGILVEAAATGGHTSNITIDNINVINCGREGIKVGAAATKTYDVHINNCSVSQCSGSIQYGNLTNARATANLTGVKNAIGILLHNVSNGAIANSSASHNQIDGVNNADANQTTLSDNDSESIGIKLDTCDNLNIENCVCNNQKGPHAFGMHMSSCNNIVAKNVLANNNAIKVVLVTADSNSAAATGPCNCKKNVAGFYMEDSEFCKFEDCVANNNTAFYRAANSGALPAVDGIYTDHAAGFMMLPKTDTAGGGNYGVNNHNQFVRCQAHSNKGGRFSYAGTAIAYTDDIGTLAEGNWANIRFGAGFLAIGADTNAVATIVTTSDDHHTIAGDAMNTGNVFLECRASGNHAFAGEKNRDTKGVGIALLFDNASTVRNCALISNGVVTSASKVMGAGLYLGPRGYSNDKGVDDTYKAAYTRNALIESNWLVANTWFGLVDDALDCQSLIMSNFAFRNGSANGELAEGHLSQEDINYHVQYEQSDENLPTTHATIGDFGPLTVAHAYANVDISVLAESSTVGHETAGAAHVEDTGDYAV